MSNERTLDLIADVNRSPIEKHEPRIYEALAQTGRFLLAGKIEDATEHAKKAKEAAEKAVAETKTDIETIQTVLWQHLQEETRTEESLKKASASFERARLWLAVAEDFGEEWSEQQSFLKEASHHLAEAAQALK